MQPKLNFIMIVLGVTLLQPAWVLSVGLPDNWERAVYVIEMNRPPGWTCPPSRKTTSAKEEAEQPEFCPNATGFLMRICGQSVLVSNRHVFEPQTLPLVRDGRVVAHHRINRFIHAERKSGGSLRLPVGSQWRAHPNPKIDLAASLIGLPAGVNQEEIYITFFDEDTDRQAAKWTSFFLDLSQLRGGDEILTIGFPVSIPGIREILKTHGRPLLRSGIISLILPGDIAIGDKEFSDIFLIDSWNFQGNSGSPVFWKPTMARYADRGFNIRRPYIVGVVSSFLNWDVPIEPLTQPVLVARTNAGLSIIQAASGIETTVAQFPGASCVPRPQISPN
jgi:hypothetical protein